MELATIMREVMPVAPTLAEFEEAEARLLELPQVDCPLTHRFAPGIYLREILMPAGTFIIGAEHRTEHFNVVLSGRALVMINGEVKEITAPTTFVSKPGVRKTLLILEDMRWQTLHPTDETDLEKLEPLLVKRTTADLRHRQELAKLKQAALEQDESIPINES